MWTYWITDTMTGTKLHPVRPSSGSWSTRLNATGSGSHTFHMPRPALDWDYLTKHWSRTIVPYWNGVPIGYEGIINRRAYNRDAGTLTIDHADVRSLWGARTLMGIDGFNPLDKEERIGYSPESLYRMEMRLLFEGVTPGFVMNFDDSYYLDPLTAPHDGTAEFKVTDYQFPNAMKALDLIQNMDGGPDTHYTCRETAGAVERFVRIGTPLTGPLREFHMEAMTPGLKSYQSVEDGSQMNTIVYLGGEGTEELRPVGSAMDTTPDIPALEYTGSVQNVDSIDTLNSLAQSRLDRYRTPLKEVTVVASAQYAPVDQLVLGQILRLRFQSDPFEADTVDLRLLGMSSDGTDDVTLTVQAA